MFFAEGLEGLYRLIKGEELIDEYKSLEFMGNLPSFFRKIIVYVLAVLKQERIKKIFKFTKPLDGLEF